MVSGRADKLCDTSLLTMSSLVRPIRRDDVAQIKRIVEAVGLFPSTLLEKMIEPYFTRPDNRQIWIGHQAGQFLAGFAFCEPERMTTGTWNVLAIGVLPQLHGRGIGAELMGHLKRSLADAGERILLVETSSLPEFERARRFYRTLNYTEEARIREFYDDGDDKIVFYKRLG